MVWDPVCEACQEEFLDEAEDVQEVERIWLWEALKARVAAWDEWWGIGAEEGGPTGRHRPRRGWSVHGGGWTWIGITRGM